MKLTAFNKVYDLELDVLHYFNGRTAFELYDYNPEEPGPFCFISENHPEISDELIFNNLPGHEAIVIDNDFIACFNSEREAKIWIKDNIPECVITGDIDGRDCFYIKQTSEQGN